MTQESSKLQAGYQLRAVQVAMRELTQPRLQAFARAARRVHILISKALPVAPAARPVLTWLHLVLVLLRAAEAVLLGLTQLREKSRVQIAVQELIPQRLPLRA